MTKYMSDENFSMLKAGLQDAVNHIQGKEVLGIRVHIPDEINTKLIREKLGMSQDAFAQAFGLSRGTLRDWEQGRKSPNKQAKILLKLISKDPQYVLTTLQAA